MSDVAARDLTQCKGDARTNTTTKNPGSTDVAASAWKAQVDPGKPNAMAKVGCGDREDKEKGLFFLFFDISWSRGMAVWYGTVW